MSCTCEHIKIPKSNRLAIVEISPSYIATTMCYSHEHHIRITSSVPKDAKPVRVGYDPIRHVFLIMLEHESFEPVMEGTTPPTLDPPSIYEIKCPYSPNP